MRFAVTIFLSAFLLFQVQPLMGRFVLPWFGGTPAVWTTCMLLFQVLLLGGYAYAHGLASMFKPRTQGIVHLGLLLASLFFLPVVPNEALKPTGEGEPISEILKLLTITTGIPYLLLSSTGPLLQSWFSRTYPGRTPYRLYALSNAGSLLALLSYPLAVEPWFPLRDQAMAWSIGFGLFVLVCGWTAFKLIGSETHSDETVVKGFATTENSSADNITPVARPTWRDVLFWLSAAACGSALLLSITNQMCQEVAVVPFLWVLPLALYLITFIISFDCEHWYRRAIFGTLWLLGACATVWLLYEGPKANLWLQIGGLTLALFGGCMICHGELVRSKPAPRYLTLFYLSISAGGALGGFFVAVVAPLTFSGYWELHIALELCSLLACWAWFRDPASILYRGQPWWGWAPLASLLIVQQGFLSKNMLKSNEDVLDRSRNFYGVLRVKEYGVDSDVGGVPLRSMVHGNILHGVQFVDEELSKRATTYYGADSGVGVAILNHPKRTIGPSPGIHIGVVGLGTGTVAAYGREEDRVTFYEINPEVVRLNLKWYSYLTDCPAAYSIVLGDARIQMERQLKDGKPQGFDVLVVDAFSSDAIPMHLLTLECFRDIYWKHLNPDGILAIHVSNNHLNLVPIVRGLAAAVGKPAIWIYGDQNDEQQLSSCSWILVTDNLQFLGDPLVKMEQSDWLGDDPPPLVWTDDYGAILQIQPDLAPLFNKIRNTFRGEPAPE